MSHKNQNSRTFSESADLRTDEKPVEGQVPSDDLSAGKFEEETRERVKEDPKNLHKREHVEGKDDDTQDVIEPATPVNETVRAMATANEAKAPARQKEAKEKQKDEPVADRSEFNCEACEGSGLNGNVRCDSCLGTGKVK